MLRQIHDELGIPADYGSSGQPPRYDEANELVDVGPNVVGRVQRLHPRAATQWFALSEAADEDGVRLLLVSGYRSWEYQAGLIRRKLEAGQLIEDILRVNAAPGYSEHHSGLAMDLATPGSRPLTEEFEDSDAFRWLGQRAGDFGFSMSYPRGNAAGFIYEPWHWALGGDSGPQA